jgi:hypothetical protein
MTIRRMMMFSLALFAFVYLLSQSWESQAQATPSIISGKFYKLDVIAASGESPLTTVLAAPSINDNGLVSFAGNTTNNVRHVFISEAPAFWRSVRQTNLMIGGNTQINNSNQIVAHDTDAAQRMVLNIWDGNTSDSPTIAAGANGGGGFNHFARFHPNQSLNNNGQLAFSGQERITNTNLLITGTRFDPNFSQTALPAGLHPMLADTGNLVVRAGSLTTSPIRLYNYSLSSFTDIATTAMGFTALGARPSISDNGEVIVFYGVLGTNTLNLTTGPGIFASIDVGTPPRRIIRLTNRQVENLFMGGNDDGVCDPMETCRAGELGFGATNNALFFTSFQADSRVGVAHLTSISIVSPTT